MTVYYRLYNKLVSDTEATRLTLFSCEMKPRGEGRLTPVDKQYHRHQALDRGVFVASYKMHESPEAAVEAYIKACENEIRGAETRIRTMTQLREEAEALRAKLARGEPIA